MKIIGGLVLAGVLTVGGLYAYYIHTPSVSAPALTGEFKRAEATIDNLPRRYAYYIPGERVGSLPIIFVLHGSRTTGALMRKATAFEFDTLADRHGFIAVYPDGYEKHWNDCRISASYAANIEDIDDIAFLTEIIDQLAATYDVDRDKVYVTGMSNGGHMAYKMGLEAPQTFSGIAAIGANLPIEENSDCSPQKVGISVAIFNGTKDAINPYDGGLVEVSGDISRGAVMSSEATAGYWAGLATATRLPGLIEHRQAGSNPKTWASEARWVAHEHEIRLYTLNGSGHVVPSQLTRMPRLLGPAAEDLSAANEIVAFFLRPADTPT